MISDAAFARMTGRLSLRIPALLLLWMLGGCATTQRNCALVPLATLPLDSSNNLLMVTAGIAGKPVHLLVDTGAERTVLTEAATRRLALAPDGHHTRSVGIGGSSASSDAQVPGIVLGGVRFPVERVAVGNFKMGDLFLAPVDGLLGADILLAFDLDIDIPDQRLTLYRTRHCAGAVPPWPAVEIPGVGARRDRMLVPIKVDGANGMALLDTGAQTSAISAEMAERAGVSQQTLRDDPVILVHGVAPKPVAMPIQQFHVLRMGPVRINDPHLVVVPGTGGLGDGLVGADVIHGRRIWLSFGMNRLFLARQPGD